MGMRSRCDLRALGLVALAWWSLQPRSVGFAQASGSNADNYDTGVNVEVSHRTGSISLAAELFRLPGIRHEISASISLHYDSSQASTDLNSGASVFGLPPGWSMNLSYLYVAPGVQYSTVNIDGNQSYPYTEAWLTSFEKEDGSTTEVNTQLIQYNRADADFFVYDDVAPPVSSVCDIQVAAGIRNLNGMTRLVSEEGLMLSERDRFGNHIDFCYTAPAAPSETRLKSLTDTWGNEVVFCYCDGTEQQDAACDAILADCQDNVDRVTILLPDGRSVGYVIEGVLLTEVFDAQGKTTALSWTTDPAECRGTDSADSLTQVVSPTGGVTQLEYACLPVCFKGKRDTGEDDCTTVTDGTTEWPVVRTAYTCPDTSVECAGHPLRLTTEYDFGGATSEPNYTGFPTWSPFGSDPNFPGSDSLMQSGQTTFSYQTTVTQTMADQTVAHRTENSYNYLHLLTQSITRVGSDLELGKSVVHCYEDLDADGNCASVNFDYTMLPANYQSAKATGSCVFSVDGVGTQGSARISLVTREYDSFGHVTHERKYHGSSATGVIACAQPEDAFAPNQLTVVTENFHNYDVPQQLDDDSHLSLGEGSGHYGLLTASAAFAYADELALEDARQYCGAGTRPAGGAPLRATLSCLTLEDGSGNVPTGTMIKSHLAGSLSLSTPAEKSVLDQCASPSTASWDLAYSPPKVTNLTYDGNGRVTGRTLSWSSIGKQQPGITSSSESLSYARSSPQSVSPTRCAGDSSVLVTTHTDAKGFKTVTRSCTENGFLISTTDADGDTTSYQHDAVGMTTLVSHPNGTQTAMKHFYACPTSASGVETCPAASSSAFRNCPYSFGNSCVERTLIAGQGNTSYADGIQHVVVKDGMGRTLETWDNLGGASFDAFQLRSQRTYDSLGLMTSHSSRVGTDGNTPFAPLIYTTSTTYGPKFRPQTVCGPRLTAQQFVHDDVMQTTKTYLNGNQRELVEYNDSQKPTVITDCGMGVDTSGTGVGLCPSTAADLQDATCSEAQNYLTTLLRDGSGVTHTTSAADLNAGELGASTECLAGTTNYSADLHKYSYEFNNTTPTNTEADNTFVGGSSTWQRDLHGLSVIHNLTLDTTNDLGTGGTAGSGGSGGSGIIDSFASDTYAYNELGQETNEINKLSTNAITLQNLFTYTDLGQVSTHTDYAGTTFRRYYDSMKRLTRFCYATKNVAECEGIETSSCDGTNLCCTAGETYTRDPITGRATQVMHFTNPSTSCSATSDGDVEGDSIHYAYMRFGAISSKTYVQNVVGAQEGDGDVVTAALRWGYDPYQRLVCFRDVMADIENGNNGSDVCGDATSAVAADFAPSPTKETDRYLSWYEYYDDGESYLRGLLQNVCRIVSTDQTQSGFDVRCTEVDYFTPTDSTGGDCTGAAQSLSAPGGYAGLVKSRTHCKGATCSEGGTVMYSTTYNYDSHRRPCRVLSLDADSKTILGSTYVYDQYDNLVSETSFSDLDSSTDSNYAHAFLYDGMMRLLNRTRTDLDGNLLQTIDYQYDAASNIKTKVEKIYAATGGTGGSGAGGMAGTGGTDGGMPGAGATDGDPDSPTTSSQGGCDAGMMGAGEGSSAGTLQLLIVLFVVCRARRRVGRTNA